MHNYASNRYNYHVLPTYSTNGERGINWNGIVAKQVMY